MLKHFRNKYETLLGKFVELIDVILSYNVIRGRQLADRLCMYLLLNIPTYDCFEGCYSSTSLYSFKMTCGDGQ